MSTSDYFALAAFIQLLERVGPCRVQQSIANHGAIRLDQDERLGDEAGETDHHIGRLNAIRNDGSRGDQGKRPGKDRQTSQNGALRFGQ